MMADDKPQMTGYFHIQRVLAADITPQMLQYVKEGMTRYLLNTLALALADGRERTVQVFDFRRAHPMPWKLEGHKDMIEYEINALALLLDPKLAQVGEYVSPYLMPKLERSVVGFCLRLPVAPPRSCVDPGVSDEAAAKAPMFDTLVFEPVEFFRGGPHPEKSTAWKRISSEHPDD